MQNWMKEVVCWSFWVWLETCVFRDRSLYSFSRRMKAISSVLRSWSADTIPSTWDVTRVSILVQFSCEEKSEAIISPWHFVIGKGTKRLRTSDSHFHLALLGERLCKKQLSLPVQIRFSSTPTMNELPSAWLSEFFQKWGFTRFYPRN